MTRIRSCVSLVLLSQTWTCIVSAGNDDEVLVGIDATLTGGAVTAVVSDGSSLWYNPAGLSGKGKHQVDVSGTAYTLRLWRIPEFLKATDGTVQDGNTMEAVVVPSAITYVRGNPSGWSLGAGYFLSRWSDIRGNSSLTVPDGGAEATWQVGYVQTYSLHNVVLGASYRKNSDFSFGFGINGMYNGFNYANEVSGGIEAGIDSSFITATEHGLQSHYALQLTAGVLFTPAENWQIGVSARTPAVALLHHYEQHSFQTLAFDLNQVPGHEPAPGEENRPQVYNSVSSTRSEWKPDWLLPPRVRLGVAYLLDGGWISADVDFQSGIRSQPVLLETATFVAVDRAPIVNARVGFKKAVGEMTSIGAGLFTDRTGDRQSLLGVGKFNFYGVSLGAEFSDVHRIEDEERSTLRFATGLGVRYAYGIGRFQTSEIPEFYSLIADYLNGGDGITTIETPATAHELTFNLGAGIYF